MRKKRWIWHMSSGTCDPTGNGPGGCLKSPKPSQIWGWFVKFQTSKIVRTDLIIRVRIWETQWTHPDVSTDNGLSNVYPPMPLKSRLLAMTDSGAGGSRRKKMDMTHELWGHVVHLTVDRTDIHTSPKPPPIWGWFVKFSYPHCMAKSVHIVRSKHLRAIRWYSLELPSHLGYF